MLFLALLAVVGALLVVQYFKLLRSNGYSRQIPSVQRTYPLLGNIPSFWGKNSKQALWTLIQSSAKVDRLGKLLIGPRVIVLINHPDLLQQVLTRSDLHDKPFFYDFMGLGSGLITERNGKHWLMERNVLNPTFNTRMLTSFIPIMDARSKKMVEAMRPRADGRTEIDLLKYVGECTLEMVFNTTMGRNANELPGQKDYVRHLDIIMTRLGERMLNVNQFLDVFYRMSKAYKSEYASRMYCNEFTDKIIRERRVELENEKRSDMDEDEFYRKSLNFLDQILTIQKGDGTSFTDQQISDNLYSMMSAAHETSAVTVSYACLFLAMYPEIQAKVLAEMNEVFYSDEVEVTVDTLKQLQYTEQVIKEVLRLCPAVPIGARETSSGDLQLDGIRIPPNQIVVFNFYTLHRRKDIWGADPERFDPDRFLPEACRERHPYAYLPFSAGLRNCIGGRYAMNSMRIMLLRILQAFEVRTNLKQSDLRFKFEITLKLVGPHSVWLEKRMKEGL